MKSVVFAGGCFWGVENYFKLVPGVRGTLVGYIDGNYKFPTYEMVCTGITGHTEACKVDYDPSETNLFILLEHFFFIIDPTTLNKQGMDTGTQYRTGVYYFDEEDKKLTKEYIDIIKECYHDPIVVEVKPAKEFWEAEDYHQNYLDNNPNGYCHIMTYKYKLLNKIDQNARSKI
jgi:peptide-methionine (S)-S-oxide reductase